VATRPGGTSPAGLTAPWTTGRDVAGRADDAVDDRADGDDGDDGEGVGDGGEDGGSMTLVDTSRTTDAVPGQQPARQDRTIEVEVVSPAAWRTRS
jgi:hypothetical protein